MAYSQAGILARARNPASLGVLGAPLTTFDQNSVTFLIFTPDSDTFARFQASRRLSGPGFLPKVTESAVFCAKSDKSAVLLVLALLAILVRFQASQGGFQASQGGPGGLKRWSRRVQKVVQEGPKDGPKVVQEGPKGWSRELGGQRAAG